MTITTLIRKKIQVNKKYKQIRNVRKIFDFFSIDMYIFLSSKWVITIQHFCLGWLAHLVFIKVDHQYHSKLSQASNRVAVLKI